MSKSFLKETEEQRGSVPGCTGALLEIISIERGKTSERSQTPGLRKYVPTFKILQPKNLAGMQVKDQRITVGTPEDPLAKKPETWDRQEGGPGRLKRLLTRSGTPISDDDEEWMEAAEGNQVVAPLIPDPAGEFPTAPGLYYRPSDDDCPEIGLAEDDGKGKRGGKGKAKGAAQAAKKARGSKKDVEPDEEEEDEAEEPADEDDEEDEEEEAPKKGKGKKASKAEEDEDEEEDDYEEEPPPKKRGRPPKAKKVEEDEEDDD